MKARSGGAACSGFEDGEAPVENNGLPQAFQTLDDVVEKPLAGDSGGAPTFVRRAEIGSHLAKTPVDRGDFDTNCIEFDSEFLLNIRSILPSAHAKRPLSAGSYARVGSAARGI